MTFITPRNVGIAIASTVGAVGAGVLVRTLLHDHRDAPGQLQSRSHARQGVDHLPTYSWKGRDLAVAWWPENMRIDHARGGDQLHFESIVGNLGDAKVSIAPGDHMSYEVFRRNDDGSLGNRVGTGSASIDRLDVIPFPPPFGESTGKPSSAFGVKLAHVDHLDPRTAGVIGADQPSQSVDMTGAGPGSYVLRQTIVRASHAGDPDAHDDVRDTGFMVGTSGWMLQTSSAYAG